MDKLSQQELVRIRRGAEDAIQAMNRNHKSFIEAVSHPLNIIALVDMAQASVKQQAKVEELQVQLKGAEERAQLILQYKDKYRLERDELQKRVVAAIEAINEHYESDGMSGLYFMDLKEILEGEQALKGGR